MLARLSLQGLALAVVLVCPHRSSHGQESGQSGFLIASDASDARGDDAGLTDDEVVDNGAVLSTARLVLAHKEAVREKVRRGAAQSAGSNPETSGRGIVRRHGLPAGNEQIQDGGDGLPAEMFSKSESEQPVSGSNLHFIYYGVGRIDDKETEDSFRELIRRMAIDHWRTGQRHYVVFNEGVRPELISYARQWDVGVRIESDSAFRGASLALKAGKGFNAVLDTVSVSIDSIDLLGDWEKFLNGNVSGVGLAHQSAIAGSSLADASYSLSGMLRPTYHQTVTPSMMVRMGRIARVAGYGVNGAAVGLRFYQWYYDEISTRELVTEAASVAGGFAGAWMGAKVGGLSGAQIGGAAGSVLGPAGATVGAAAGGTVGAIVGAVGGGWLGQNYADQGIRSVLGDEDLERQVRREMFLESLMNYESQRRYEGTLRE